VNRATVRVAIYRFRATVRRRWGGDRAPSTRRASTGSAESRGTYTTSVPDLQPGASPGAAAVAPLPRLAARRLTALSLGAE
jgi:hypothetical protein